MKLRLFFAINFNQEIKQRFFEISSSLQKFNEPIKYEPVEKLHLTLLFLGNVEESLIPLINQYSLNISSNFSKADITFENLGVFKNFKQPRVIWIGMNDNPELKKLSLELRNMVNQFGIITEEREFAPHITIGRVKGKLSSKFIDYLKSFKFDPFTTRVESFELMESKLDSSGSKYFIKGTFTLKKNSSNN